MIPLCRHIKPTGQLCRAIALRQKPYCYFHHRLLDRHRTYRRDLTREWQTANYITLDAIEDRHGLQIALSQVVNAAAVGQLETRLATVLLRGLNAIAGNLNQLEKLSKPEAAPVHAALLSPDGLDLASPETAPPETDPSEAALPELAMETKPEAESQSAAAPAPASSVTAHAGATTANLPSPAAFEDPAAAPVKSAGLPRKLPPPSLARLRMYDALGVSSLDRQAIQRDLESLAHHARNSTIYTEHPHGYTAP